MKVPCHMQRNTLDIIYLLFFLWSLACLPWSAQAEIYKWTDENGRVHFSDKAPSNNNAKDISAELSSKGNFFGFTKVKPIDVYIPKRRRGLPKLTIKIELVQYELSEGDRKEIIKGVKKVYKAFTTWFGWPIKPKEPIKIKIFGKYSDFLAYQRSTDGRHVSNRSFYHLLRKEIVMLGTRFNEETVRTLFHEATHAIFHMRHGIVPLWLDEGLAMAFSAIEPEARGLKLSLPVAYHDFVRAKLREGTLLSFGEYLQISNRQWRTSGQVVESTYYRVAWSMMMFMLSSKQGSEALENIITQLDRSRWWQTNNLAGHFARHYPGGLDRLDKNWRRWIKKSH